MSSPVLYGASYSVYTRIARLVLEEKSIVHDFVGVDIFADDPGPEASRHPFHKIPTFHHDGVDLYETGAIARYLDDVAPQPALMPTNPEQCARANQVISVLDNYAYPSWIWGLYVQLVDNPANDIPTDQGAVNDAYQKSLQCIVSIAALNADGSRYLVGPNITLADLYAVPMYAYLVMSAEGNALVANTMWPQWWETMQSRTSVNKTRFPGEIGH